MSCIEFVRYYLYIIYLVMTNNTFIIDFSKCLLLSCRNSANYRILILILAMFINFLAIVVQSLSMSDSATPWTVAHRVSLSFKIFQSLLRCMSTELVMPSNDVILCHLLLFLPSIFPSIRVFSNELTLHIRWPKSQSFSISLSNDSQG